MRYLAIDHGNKRTGLAICDADETIASPLAVLRERGTLAKRIAEIIQTENVDAIVLGLPLNMDGSEGGQAKLVRKFAETLMARTDVPLHFQDERLSSFGAEEKLREAGMTRKKKAKRLDAIAAAEILTAFLERKKGQ